LGTPFSLFTNGTTPRGLFADAYQPRTPVTGAASAVDTSSATLSGSVNPDGASVNTSFQFGTTTAYGDSTAPQKTGPDNAVDQFSAQLTGLPAGTTIHYRAVATSDFGTFVGADQTLTTTTASPPPPPPPAPPGQGRASVGHAHVSGNTARVPVTCTGAIGATCQLVLRLTVTEQLRGRKLIAFTAGKQRTRRQVLVVGTTTLTLNAGTAHTISISLNRAGRTLLAAHRHLKATLRVSQATPGRPLKTVSTQTVVFTARHHRLFH
jgi:hypothetical protein